MQVLQLNANQEWICWRPPEQLPWVAQVKWGASAEQIDDAHDEVEEPGARKKDQRAEDSRLAVKTNCLKINCFAVGASAEDGPVIGARAEPTILKLTDECQVGIQWLEAQPKSQPGNPAEPAVT